MNLSPNVKIKRVMNAVAAGTSAQNSSVIDMQGFEGVMFIAAFGEITSGAVTSIKAQQDTVLAFNVDPKDLEDSSISIADDDDNQVAVLDIYKPRERFVRLAISRGSQAAVIDGVIAIQYKGKKLPTTHDVATVVAAEVHASPAEGTA